jgi:hypothetical protein
MFIELKEGKGYYMIGIEKTEHSFNAYVEREGNTIKAEYSDLTEKFYYEGKKKLPKYIERILLENAKDRKFL